MLNLSNLRNTTRTVKSKKRVGRGIGSGVGKTCGRGEKGQGARSGSKRRYGYEGGQFPLFMKLPQRGFNNFNFRHRLDTINLWQIETMFNDGDIVNIKTLKAHGYFTGKTHGIKILGTGELTKKVTFEVQAVTKGARDKLLQAKIPFTIVKNEKKPEQSK